MSGNSQHASLLKDGLVLSGQGCPDLLDGLGAGNLGLPLLDIPGSRTSFALLLQSIKDVALLPAHLLCEIAETTKATLWLQAQDLQCLRDHKLLLDVIWMWHSFEGLQAIQCRCAPSGLVWDHASHSPPEHLGWSAVVEWTTTRVGVHLLALKVCVLELVAEERAGDVDVLGAQACHMLTVEEFLGYNGCESAEQVSLAINDHLLLE
mmetsp:Transcript_47828/g.87948  ORF Transcript_47828/g.87948 Transcript_47828/m.87948 type:complete len:207 (-) Transcript_47828:112-732(-)